MKREVRRETEPGQFCFTGLCDSQWFHESFLKFVLNYEGNGESVLILVWTCSTVLRWLLMWSGAIQIKWLMKFHPSIRFNYYHKTFFSQLVLSGSAEHEQNCVRAEHQKYWWWLLIIKSFKDLTFLISQSIKTKSWNFSRKLRVTSSGNNRRVEWSIKHVSTTKTTSALNRLPPHRQLTTTEKRLTDEKTDGGFVTNGENMRRNSGTVL